MADISNIQIGTGTYDIKDVAAREGVGIVDNKIKDIVAPKNYKKKKYLLVGDSYAVGYQGSGASNIEGYFTKVVNDLGLTAQIVCANGYGFLGINNENKWKDLLQATTINNKETFTDIFICGGMNDRNTAANIETAMEDLFSYLYTNFPNAEIHVGCVGRYSKQTAQNLNSQRKVSKLYHDVSVKNGVKYITNSDKILHCMSWFISDNIHPNTVGQAQLAYGIKQYIINGLITDIMLIGEDDFKEDTVTAANDFAFAGHIYSRVNPTNATLYFQGGFTTNVNKTISNNGDIIICQLNDSYICSSAYNQGINQMVDGYIYSVDEIDGQHHFKVPFLLYNDNENYLHLKPFTVKDNGGYRSYTINEINFPYGAIQCLADTRYC